MEFLGELVPERRAWIDEPGAQYWEEHPAYTYCPGQDGDEQMQCLKYESSDTTTWECKHVDGDICMVKGCGRGIR
uniref:Uncharacterized protein n=1 Tax=viral metagenome TaxID=1070528 RepID=A0A6M3XSM0_9ZZZZ